MPNGFPPKVQQELAARVLFLCSNPDCLTRTIGPRLGRASTGRALQMLAASPVGLRGDSEPALGERSTIENGIWVCRPCAWVVDCSVDDAKFSGAKLREWKRQAEEAARLRLDTAEALLGRKHRFSAEEIELLIEATLDGEFFINSGGRIGRWVRAGATHFINPDDQEIAADYLSAFYALDAAGLVRRVREQLYRLSEIGLRVSGEFLGFRFRRPSFALAEDDRADSGEPPVRAGLARAAQVHSAHSAGAA
jgi:hypothetical protein